MALATAPLAAFQPEFECGPHQVGELAVLAFEASEELSRPFSVKVPLVAAQDVDRAGLIGQKAVLIAQHANPTSVSSLSSFEDEGMTLSTEERCLFKVGSATIETKKSGEVVIKGAKIEVKASGDIILKASKISEN
jgi:type VI secretion system secreted protein VgrG